MSRFDGSLPQPPLPPLPPSSHPIHPEHAAKSDTGASRGRSISHDKGSAEKLEQLIPADKAHQASKEIPQDPPAIATSYKESAGILISSKALEKFFSDPNSHTITVKYNAKFKTYALECVARDKLRAKNDAQAEGDNFNKITEFCEKHPGLSQEKFTVGTNKEEKSLKAILEEKGIQLSPQTKEEAAAQSRSEIGHFITFLGQNGNPTKGGLVVRENKVTKQKYLEFKRELGVFDKLCSSRRKKEVRKVCQDLDIIVLPPGYEETAKQQPAKTNGLTTKLAKMFSRAQTPKPETLPQSAAVVAEPKPLPEIPTKAALESAITNFPLAIKTDDFTAILLHYTTIKSSADLGASGKADKLISDWIGKQATSDKDEQVKVNIITKMLKVVQGINDFRAKGMLAGLDKIIEGALNARTNKQKFELAKKGITPPIIPINESHTALIDKVRLNFKKISLKSLQAIIREKNIPEILRNYEAFQKSQPSFKEKEAGNHAILEWIGAKATSSQTPERDITELLTGLHKIDPGQTKAIFKGIELIIADARIRQRDKEKDATKYLQDALSTKYLQDALYYIPQDRRLIDNLNTLQRKLEADLPKPLRATD